MMVTRYLILAAFLGFTGYTLYCIRKENFWKACKNVWAYHWGRQVTIDLYIGLFMFSFLIYLNEASLLVMLLWFIPTLALGNIVPLLYFFLNFESIISHFI